MDINKIMANGKFLNNSNAKGGSSKVSVSIVNSENNGKRISFSKAFLDKLNNPEALQFVLSKDDKCVVIGSDLNPDEKKYAFSKQGSNVLYCGGVIKEIVSSFSLDYSDKTSKSFDNIEFEEFEGLPVAVVYFD